MRLLFLAVSTMALGVAVPRSALGNTPTPVPLARAEVNGVWMGVPTDEDGVVWVVQVRLEAGGRGVVRLGQELEPTEVSQLSIDVVQVKRGRLHLHAVSADKSEEWQTITIDAEAKGVGGSGLARGQLAVRDGRKELLFKIPVVLRLSHDPGERLAHFRQLADAVAKSAP
jgi:hypothetical protein